jgi:hypothetical protein
LTAVTKGGGEVQLWMEQGRPIFKGSSSTEKGSEFDEIICRIVAGQSFDDAVKVPPHDVLASNGARNTKAYREWAKDQDAVCVTEQSKEAYRFMYDNMRGNAYVNRLLNETTDTQAVVLFEVGGHKLRVRPDGRCPHLWWDLKTTSTRDCDSLFYSVRDFGYDDQAWLYTEAAMQTGVEEWFRYPFVFVMTEPPYSCRAFHLPDRMVQEAGFRLRDTMESVRLRRETGLYLPDDLDELHELYVPEKFLQPTEYYEL